MIEECRPGLTAAKDRCRAVLAGVDEEISNVFPESQRASLSRAHSRHSCDFPLFCPSHGSPFDHAQVGTVLRPHWGAA